MITGLQKKLLAITQIQTALGNIGMYLTAFWYDRYTTN